MTNPTTLLFKEYFEILDSQKFIAEDLDYSKLNKDIDFFNNLDAISNSAISIFDFYKRDHAYYSSKYAELFGWDMERVGKEGLSYTDNLIHPDDIIHQLQSGIYYLKMIVEIPIHERKNYKLLTEYRLKIPDGNYIKVIEQQVLLETDCHGNIWLGLGILDLSPNRDLETPFQCRAINTKTGELYHFPPEELKAQNDLSKREIEILKLISKGLISKQIADKLFISVNTVNTHRQRIIEKLGVSSTTEALSYLRNLGLI